MFVKRTLASMPGSRFSKLVVGCALVASLISLGTVTIAKVFGVDVPPGLAATLAAAGAAAFAVRSSRSH